MSKGKLNLFSQAAVNILAIHFMYLTIIKVYPQRFDREIWRVFGGVEAGFHKPLNPLIHLT